MSTFHVFCFFITMWGICNSNEFQQNKFFQDAGPLVKTTAGAIVGKYVYFRETKIAAFFGIPYAKPPLGDRRFTKSEPAEPWDGVLFTQKESSQCMQFLDPRTDFLTFGRPLSNFSEDCLYLNIWAPNSCCCNKFEKRPVLVWIHGGGLVMGSADTNMYDGAKLAAYGGAVVVSMNYRLGVLGFLDVGSEEAPGNVGLLDQVLALKWVKENIEQFGGDPESITLFGESAGSWSISLHIISPVSRNLFHRVIMQSGSMYNFMLSISAEEARKTANDLAVEVECADDNVNLDTHPSTVIQCLRRKDPGVLSETDFRVRNSTSYVSVGNEFLPIRPILAYEARDISPVDVIMGTTRDEGTMFLPFFYSQLFSFETEPNLSLADVEKAIPILFPFLSPEQQKKLFELYFKDLNDNNRSAIMDAFQFTIGDLYMNCPIMFLSEKLNNSYMYWMTHESSASSTFPAWLGVHHGIDVAYVFGKSLLVGKSLLPRDEKFSNDIMQMWVNFAKYGHPTSEESKVQWPTFSVSENSTYELNEGHYKTTPYPRQEECNFWRSIIAIPHIKLQ